jgi:hypothetical protein
MSSFFECLLFACIKLVFKFFILPYPLVLVLILLCCISSSVFSPSSKHVDLYPILFSSFHGNTLDVLIFFVPLILCLYQKCCIVFCLIVYCVTIHTCHRWMWTISCIVSRFLTVVKNYRSSTSSKSSSSMASSPDSFFVPLIVFAQFITLCSRILFWLHIIILWWNYALLCVVILWWCSKLLHNIVLWWNFKLLCIVILWMLCRL